MERNLQQDSVSMKDRTNHVPTFIKFLLIFVAVNIVLVILLIVHQIDQHHIREKRAAQAQAYLAKNPIFPSLSALSHFVKTHFGEDSNRASHIIYRVNIYGKTECVQAIWHTGFFVVDHYAYRLFSCGGG